MKFGDEFIKIMDYIGQKIGVVIDWTSQNVTPYIQDLLARVVKFEIATSIMWIVFAILLIILGAVFVRIDKKIVEQGEGGEYILTIIAWVIWLISILIIGFQTYDIITAVFIPEKIYLDYFYKIKDSIK